MKNQTGPNKSKQTNKLLKEDQRPEGDIPHYVCKTPTPWASCTSSLSSGIWDNTLKFQIYFIFSLPQVIAQKATQSSQYSCNCTPSYFYKANQFLYMVLSYNITTLILTWKKIPQTADCLADSSKEGKGKNCISNPEKLMFALDRKLIIGLKQHFKREKDVVSLWVDIHYFYGICKV